MAVVLDALTLDPAESGGTVAATATPELLEQLGNWSIDRGFTGTDPAIALRAVTLWSRLHGLVSLEIENNVASMGLDSAALFDAALHDLGEPIRSVGGR